jgi:hypothetical protein
MESAGERLEHRIVRQLINPKGKLNQKATGYERTRGR